MVPGGRPTGTTSLESQNLIMGNLVYLLLAVGLVVLGWVALRMRQRGPSSVSSGVERFESGMQAIRPMDQQDRRNRR
ncbi:hypothetical protein B7486_77095 [cyanobacterium TDX16]|nr:hypothetical protein B7486_77095 [cyanobacterium TDX16]